jgi:hypothetical protein
VADLVTKRSLTRNDKTYQLYRTMVMMDGITNQPAIQPVDLDNHKNSKKV